MTLQELSDRLSAVNGVDAPTSTISTGSEPGKLAGIKPRMPVSRSARISRPLARSGTSVKPDC